MTTKRTVTISLRLSAELMTCSDRFGLLHVRDGKDELPERERGPLLNRTVKTSKTGADTIGASVRFAQHLGFQFKFFFDHGDSLTFERAKQLLEDAGYLEVTRGEGVRGRAWFIHPDYPTCKTVDGFANNYYYPQ